MLMGHYPESYHQADDGSEKMKDESHPSMKSKMKNLWNDKVKPAFPEAIADISIVKNAFKAESSVKQDIHDITRFPEIMKVAEVRKGLDLGLEERRFLEMRKVHVRNSFAKYLGLDPAEVHPDDVPTVGFGGSGGGFRAMIGTLGYTQAMKKSGLWDLLTYAAGVSGACWSLAAYYILEMRVSTKSSITARKDSIHIILFPRRLFANFSLHRMALMSHLAHWLRSITVVCTMWQWICIPSSRPGIFSFVMMQRKGKMLQDTTIIGTNGRVQGSTLKLEENHSLSSPQFGTNGHGKTGKIKTNHSKNQIIQQ